MSIRNTATDPYARFETLAHVISGGQPGDAIVAMEKEGQTQLVNSDRLPTRIQGGDVEMFVELGFTFGDVDEADPLFRPASLPAGWRRQASDHDMWSYLLDQHGRRRVAIFYKAAFYDRKATMRLEAQGSYLRSVLHGDQVFVLDDAWLTADLARGELEAIRDEELGQAAEYDGWAQRQPDNAARWREDADEARERALRTQQLIDSLPAVS